MAPASRARKRSRGEIETLPSGSLRVRVYAGIDPVSGKRHYLTKTIPAGSDAAAATEKVRTRFLGQVDERRIPRTTATVNQLMDRYLELLDVERTTRSTYEGYIRNHIRPVLGNLVVGRLDGEVLDSFYAQLRKCRAPAGRAPREYQGGDAHRTPGRPGSWDERLTEAYTYSAADNITAIAETQGGAVVANQCFQFDGLQRMTQAWTTTATACQVTASLPNDQARVRADVP